MATKKYRAPAFRLNFGAPIGTSGINTAGYIDTSPDAQTLSITSKAPGGYDTCTIGFQGARFSGGSGIRVADLDYLKGFYDLTVTPNIAYFGQGGPLAFNGRALKIHRLGNFPSGVDAVGYGLTGLNDYVTTASSTAAGTSASILTAVLNAGGIVKAAPPAYYVDPGVVHTLKDYQYLSTSQIVDQITKEGGTYAGTQIGGSVLWDFFVYEAQQLQLVPRVVPNLPVYEIPADSRVDWTDDYTDAVSHVYVRYTVPAAGGGNTPSPAVYGPVVSPTFYNKFGFTRQVLIEGGALPSAAAAQQFASTYLSIHQDSYVTATVSRYVGDGLETALGGDVPPYLVRAGQWAKVGDNAPLVITGTNYDGVQGTLSVTLNSQPADLLSRIRDLIALSRYAVRQTEPLTGARLSYLSGP